MSLSGIIYHSHSFTRLKIYHHTYLKMSGIFKFIIFLLLVILLTSEQVFKMPDGFQFVEFEITIRMAEFSSAPCFDNGQHNITW